MSADILFEPSTSIQAASTAGLVLASALVALMVFFTQTTANAIPGSPQDITRETKFAEGEIRRYESVLATITDRATYETDARQLAKFKKDLNRLSSKLQATKQTLATLKQNQKKAEQETPQQTPEVNRTAANLLREDLKGALFALQEAGSSAIDTVMAADLNASSRSNRQPASVHDFSVSLTGQ